MLGLVAAGCGSGRSPGVASLAATTTAARAATQASPGNGSAGSGGPGSSHGGGHTFMNLGNVAQGTRFAACMRTHGVPDFPDPSTQGTIALGRSVDPSSPAFKSARSACQHLLPAGFGRPPSSAQLARAQQQLLAFSTCMRAHGIGDFPDPTNASLPRIQSVGDLDPDSQAFQAAYGSCKTHLPTNMPSKALGGLNP